jgi:protein-disulfide isomerase
MNVQLESLASFATLAVGIAVLGLVAESRIHDRRSATRLSSSLEAVHGLKVAVVPGDKWDGRGRLAMIEFSDFQCPFCGMYARDTYAKVRHTFVETGLLRYNFRHFPLEQVHPSAFKAAEASECALRQGRFWQMHDIMFSNQAALQEADLLRYGHEAGLERTAFASCLAQGMAARVRQDEADGRRLGVNVTPTFLIGYVSEDGKTVDVSLRLRGMKSFDVIKAELEKLLHNKQS